MLEQIESVDREKLKQQNHIHKDTEHPEKMRCFIDERMRQDIKEII
ncbi:MAG: hypothetical protein ACEY3M_02965 [Wolbachia sp.]